MRVPDYEANHSNVLVVLRTTNSENSKQDDHSAKIRNQSIDTFFHYYHEVDITFITTLSPFSAKIRGANSDPRYASRLYRALVANSATAGVGP